MGRLTALPPRLTPLAPRLRAMPKAADRFYTSAEWKALRAAKKAAGPAFCCVCGAGRCRLILDHRVERKDGGADLPPLAELDWYCVAHHNAKTARERARRANGGR
jgi:5-methylcytosine-specific restriction endonuclease McrA